LKIIYKQVTAS